MENSRMYNEMAILKLVQSMTKLILNPPEIYKEQIFAHFKAKGEAMYKRIKNWMDLSNEYNQKSGDKEESSKCLKIDIH
jgi:ubiquitin-conjugating enzyme E2 O